MGTSTLELAAKLRSLAESQDGYFTAAQAVTIGYADSVHHYHIRNGDWERAARGIYRLSVRKTSNYAEFSCLSLWSRGKDGVPMGVFCRETALYLHGLAERSGEAIHMAVPADFRRNSEIPANLVLHKADLSEDEIVTFRGVRITTIERTSRDLGGECTKPKILDEANHVRRSKWLDDEEGEGVYRRFVPSATFDEMLERGED